MAAQRAYQANHNKARVADAGESESDSESTVANQVVRPLDQVTITHLRHRRTAST